MDPEDGEKNNQLQISETTISAAVSEKRKTSEPKLTLDTLQAVAPSERSRKRGSWPKDKKEESKSAPGSGTVRRKWKGAALNTNVTKHMTKSQNIPVFVHHSPPVMKSLQNSDGGGEGGGIKNTDKSSTGNNYSAATSPIKIIIRDCLLYTSPSPRD